MFCCVRPDLSPDERLVHDILKEFQVRVEPLEDSTSGKFAYYDIHRCNTSIHGLLKEHNDIESSLYYPYNV
jgi:hypothetical protein